MNEGQKENRQLIGLDLSAVFCYGSFRIISLSEATI